MNLIVPNKNYRSNWIFQTN